MLYDRVLAWWNGIKHPDRAYYGLLFVVCLVAFGAIAATNILQGTSLIWLSDGEALYYNFFIYEGEMIRSFFASVWQGSVSFPLYSFGAGYGADILGTMAGCLNDPFNLVSVVVPPAYAEYAFEGLVFVRFFLAAVAFSLYALSKGNSRSASFCGSLCYILCGYAVFWGVLRHPNFLNEAILLPLLLLGADKVFEKKSPALFIIAMAGQFFFSVYFSYMVLIALVIYCLLAYGFRERDKSVRDFLRLLGTFVIYIVTGALIAGVALVPLVLMLTSMGRVGLSRDIAPLDTLAFYAQYVSNLLGASLGKRSLVVGSVGVIGVIAFLVSGRLLPFRTRVPWLIGLVICVLASLTPIAGSIMNGFGYSSDRWMFVFSFCVAYALVLAVPVLKQFSRRQWIAFSVLSIVALSFIVVFAVFDGSRRYFGMAAIFLAVVVLTILLGRKAPAPVVTVVLSVCMIASTSLSVAVLSGTFGGRNGLGTYQDLGDAYRVAYTIPFDQFSSDVDDQYRIETSGVLGTRNQSFVQGYKGVDFYSSFYNQNVDDFRQSLGISDSHSNIIFAGHDGRFALEGVMAARYCVVDTERSSAVPYGYEKVKDLGVGPNGGQFVLYENKSALPLAFVYDKAVSEASYYDLSMLERQELLTKACVLGAEPSRSYDAVGLSATSIYPLVPVAQESAVQSEGSISVYEKKGSVDFDTESTAPGEQSFVAENLSLVPLSLDERIKLQQEFGESVSPSGVRSRFGWTPVKSSKIRVASGDTSRTFRIVNSRYTTYGGKVDWVVNLGYSATPLTSCSLTFQNRGICTYDDLYLASQDVEAIAENLKALQEHNTTSISLDTNRVRVHVDPQDSDETSAHSTVSQLESDTHSDGFQNDTSQQSRYVFLSIPYSEGWSATVDGTPVPIQKANVGFMAFEVDTTAPHDIELTYCTPGLPLGAGCSLIGLLVLVGILVTQKKAEKHDDSL